MNTNLVLLLSALLINGVNIISLFISLSDFVKNVKENDPIHEMEITTKKIGIAGFIVIEMILIFFTIKELIR